MPRLAANISMLFREAPLIERFAAAAQAGFTAVECLWPYELAIEQIRAELDQYRLELALINTPVGSGGQAHMGLAADAARRDDFRRCFDLAFHNATSLGARGIHVMVGECAPSAENRAALIANLREAGRKAEDAGLFLTIEPINARDRPNWFLHSTGQALDILDEVDLPTVKLQFDIYHVQIIEGDLTRRLERCIGAIGHIQIAGVPERHEPDASEVSLDWIFGTLDRLGYAGFVGCEYNPRTTTLDGLAWTKRWGVVPRFVTQD